MGSNDGCCVGMAKFLAFLSFVVFLLHAASLANPYWLEKELEITIPPSPVSLKIESNIGLLYACVDREMKPLIDEYKCESLAEVDEDLVEDWQWVAAGLGCVSIICTFICFILSCVATCTRGNGVRAATIFIYFLSCVLFGATLVLFNENKEIMLLPDQKLKFEHDFNWGFYVGAVGACMLFVMAFLHAFVACGMRNANMVV